MREVGGGKGEKGEGKREKGGWGREEMADEGEGRVEGKAKQKE